MATAVTRRCAEAARCFPCHCMECVKACEYLKHYGDLSEALRARHLQQRQHRHGPSQGQSHDRQLHAVRIVRHAVPERSRHGRSVPRGAPRHGRQRPHARLASRLRAARHGAQPLAGGGLRPPSARPRRMRRRLLPRLPAIGVVALARRARLRPSRREDSRRRRPDGRLLRRAGAVERPARAARRGRPRVCAKPGAVSASRRSSPPARPA